PPPSSPNSPTSDNPTASSSLASLSATRGSGAKRRGSGRGAAGAGEKGSVPALRLHREEPEACEARDGDAEPVTYKFPSAERSLGGSGPGRVGRASRERLVAARVTERSFDRAA